MQNCFDRQFLENPGKSFPDNFFERIVEDSVEHRIGDRGQHAEEEWQRVPDGRHDGPLRENVGPELVEDRVEDQRAPADEEDGGDAPEEDVGPAASLVDLVMLAGRSKNVKINSFRLKT